MSELLSIIVPAYNAEDTIKKSLDSIRNQTYENIEIIVVNDGSTDGTGAYLDQIIEEDERITYVDITHVGTGSARNEALEEASGTYVYFADADDVMHADAAKIMVDTMEKEGCDLLTFGYNQFQHKTGEMKRVSAPYGSYSGEEIRREFTKWTSDSPCKVLGSCWNKCFRKDIIDTNEIAFPALTRNEEEVFIMSYLSFTDRIVNIPDVLYDFYPINMKKALLVLEENYCYEVDNFREIRLAFAKVWNCETDSVRAFIAREFWGKMMLGLKICKHGKQFENPYQAYCQRLQLLKDGLKEIGVLPASIKKSKLYLMLTLGMKKSLWKQL